MTDATLLGSVRARLLRRLKLVPVLFRRDPLFRYATIAAVLALIFLAVSIGQDVASHRDGPMTGAGKATGSHAKTTDRNGQNKASPSDGSETAMPPVPGSQGAPSATQNAPPPKIAPGHSLEGVDVAPAPRDDFGTVPKEKQGSR